jgi:hypothetical protein
VNFAGYKTFTGRSIVSGIGGLMKALAELNKVGQYSKIRDNV